MDNIKISHDKVKMIAHRGASSLECENTAAAFVAAGNRSYYGIETDVHVTRDGQYVVIHDSQTERVAGENLCVEKSSLSQLRDLRLFDIDGEKREDLVIPTLNEYIRICKKYNKHSFLELKETMSCENVKGIVKEVRKFDWLDNVTFISFCLDNLLALRKILPDQNMQFLTKRCSSKTLSILEEYHFGLDIKYESLTENIASFCIERGLLVNVWTLNCPDIAEEFVSNGLVNMITSNVLE